MLVGVVGATAAGDMAVGAMAVGVVVAGGTTVASISRSALVFQPLDSMQRLPTIIPLRLRLSISNR
jgi:hypothetical protein